MTDAEKDAVWRSLPEGFKRQLRCDYATAKSARSIDLTEVRIETHEKFLEMYFGKHNLTATEEKPFLEVKDADAELICRVGENPILSVKAPIDEPKPKVKVGDIVKVSQDMDWGSETFKDAKTCFCNTPSEIVEIKTERATIKSIVNGVSVLIPLKDLIPYTEEQEPENDERVDFSSSSLQNEISSLSKEDAEELAKCLAELDDSIREFKTSQVDWLAYRMELAKEVVKVVYHHKTPHKDIIDDTMSIVDGIVERLKGGEK